MYCSSCGLAVAQGLGYCNHCGAKLSGEKGESAGKAAELKAESLIISAMVGAFVLGLPAIAMLMGVMKVILDFNEPLLIAFALVSFLILLLIEGVLISRLPRRKRGAREAGDAALAKKQSTTELDAAQARALPEARASVTEGTTRLFEPSYSERKAD